MIVWMHEENRNVIIHEEKRTIKILNSTTKHILDELCHLYGSTYEGSRGAICACLQITKQVPILISFYPQIIMFPVVEKHRRTCWINYMDIENIQKQSLYEIKIIFKCGVELLLEASYRSVMRQYQRCKIYSKILMTNDLQHYIDMYYNTQGEFHET